MIAPLPDASLLATARALAALRLGDPVHLSAEAAPGLRLWPAEAAGEMPASAVALRLPGDTGFEARVYPLGAAPLPKGWEGRPLHDLAARLDATCAYRPATPLETSALTLLRYAERLPVARLAEADAAALPSLTDRDVAVYPALAAAALRPVSEARVPLADTDEARVIAFRADPGGVEHLAIAIGTPETVEAPLVRLHSSCLSGDVLGSLRCDCGSQLRLALAAIAAEGHGVLLYLQQEGRGIGFVNKLRAYALQDAGLDTADANRALGHDTDARDFAAAASMLKQLGVRTVRLLSNNPAKVRALGAEGIDIRERISLVVGENVHNSRYLATKRLRFGHHV